MVWDDIAGAPASLGGCVLEGRNEDRARAACEILKRIYQNRLDAFSIGKMPRAGVMRTRGPIMPYIVGN